MHARWLAPRLTLAICGANLHVALCQLAGKPQPGIFTRFIFLEEVFGNLPLPWFGASSQIHKGFGIDTFLLWSISGCDQKPQWEGQNQFCVSYAAGPVIATYRGRPVLAARTNVNVLVEFGSGHNIFISR